MSTSNTIPADAPAPAFVNSYMTVMVRDMDASVRFYTETLGLPLKERHGDHWAGVQAPGVLIGLHPGGDHPAEPDQSAISLGFMVDDFDAALAALTARGVQVAPPRGNDAARSASFADPDGTPLYIMQRF